MNDDLENICMNVLTEASHQQLGQKVSGAMKLVMYHKWHDIIDKIDPMQRRDEDMLTGTILTAISFGLKAIADNFTNIANKGLLVSDPTDERFKKLLDNKETMINIVGDYLKKVYQAISSVDENAIFDEYMDNEQAPEPSNEPKQTSVQQDAAMMERMRAAQAEQDPSKRMKMLADIDAEIDRQKGNI